MTKRKEDQKELQYSDDDLLSNESEKVVSFHAHSFLDDGPIIEGLLFFCYSPSLLHEKMLLEC